MALERLSLASSSQVDVAVTGGSDSRQLIGEGGDDGSKAPRLPRWTRQEILVLIQGKKVAESRVRRGRTAGLAFGSVQVEPKWASVSSYCKRHGVNRGPVQCRKRWSNLAGDYKKIKEWESQNSDESESFWVMRNDLRRERKLPGFYDREVYDTLDGVVGSSGAGADETAAGLSLALVSAADEEAEEDTKGAEAVFDSGRSATADDGLFSDEEVGGGSVQKEAWSIAAPVPISSAEKQYQPYPRGTSAPGTTNVNPPASNPEPGSASQPQEGRKRKRMAKDEDEEAGNLQDQLIEVMEKNGMMMNAQLEAHNNNLRLDREQRNDHTSSLVGVLNKLADALGRIADKL